MSLDAELMIERRRLKRQLNLWRVIGLIAVFSAIVIGVGRLNLIGDGHIARIGINGIIVDDLDRNEVLRKIAKNDKVKALIVNINSPGGSYVGGEALYEALRFVGRNKPVVALMGTTATSAGYLAALASDQIFARSS